MDGNWISDKCPGIEPYMVSLNGRMSMYRIVDDIREEYTGDVMVIAYVNGLTQDQALRLSGTDFIRKHGMITIEYKPQAVISSLLLAAERINSFHKCVLYWAKKSCPEGTCIDVIMETRDYKEIIEENSRRDRDLFVKIQNTAQYLRGKAVHPLEEVTCCNPPPISLSSIDEIFPDDIVSEVYSLYHMTYAVTAR